MDSIVYFSFFRQDLQDFLDLFYQAFRLPAIASRSGEAGGEESLATQSPSAIKIRIQFLI
jgi:hypothetical protein